MAIPKYRQELYQKRRDVMKKLLKHGDIKRLAQKILEEYPDITQSNLRDYSNYLSQVFNPRSTRPFKDELARIIEKVWKGLEYGDLDNFNAEQEHQYQLEHQDDDYRDAQRAENERVLSDQKTAQEKKREKDLTAGYKDDSILPAIFLDALKWRLHQKYPDAQILTNEILRFDSGDYIVDLLLLSNDTATPILVVEIDNKVRRGLSLGLSKISHLDFLLTESGVKRGLLATIKDGEIIENWLQK